MTKKQAKYVKIELSCVIEKILETIFEELNDVGLLPSWPGYQKKFGIACGKACAKVHDELLAESIPVDIN